MDSFSTMIIGAVDKTKNAVVKIDVFKTAQGKLRPAGSGSGFIFSSDGLIFTNCHVVEGAEKIMVSLLNENEIEGFLIGKDPSGIDDHWTRAYYQLSRYRDGSILMTALAAIDIALWDWAGKRYNAPVAQHLGHRVVCWLVRVLVDDSEYAR